MMKKFLLFCMLLVAYGAQAADNRLLVVETAGGERVTFELAASPRITFSNQTMLITSSAASHSFEMADVARYYFETTPVGVSTLQKESLHIRYAGGDEIVLPGRKSTDDIRLYAADGRQMPAAVSNGAEGAVVTLAQLPKGIYIISVNNSQTVKIYKR